MSLNLVAPFSYKNGNFLLWRRTGDKVKKSGLFLLLQYIMPDFLSEFTPINSLSSEISMNEDFRFFQNKCFFLIKLKLADQIFLQKFLNGAHNHRLFDLVVHDIIRIRQFLVIVHVFHEIDIDPFEQFLVILSNLAIQDRHLVVPYLQPPG